MDGARALYVARAFSMQSVSDSVPAPRPLARWRWWAHLLIIGSYPLMLALLNTLSPARKGQEVRLPSQVSGLLILGAIQLASLVFPWLFAWLFSRATRDELWMRWRNGVAPIWQGALYSVGLRVGVGVISVAVLIVLAVVGFDPKMLEAWIKANQPQTQGLTEAVRAGSTLYKVLMITVFSFVVAGLREEFWRAATMRGLLEILPSRWNANLTKTITLLISALAFGVGHWYQGFLGVAITAAIGVMLGAITLYHRSIWPAVIAHGFLDATTFAMVVLGADKVMK